ncbi:hypothetical protein MMC24_002175 [Lignoscripta atroalba]|nr:hypothetical protein [Lignoscripta atroalba]
MLLSAGILAFTLCVPVSLAFPQQTAYTNTTSASLATVTPFAELSCTSNCTVNAVYTVSNYWIAYSVENVTVATLIVLVNNSTNTTTTVTKYVESLMVNGTALSNTARTDTNSAGTVTSVVTGNDNVTTVVAYPTPFMDYAYSYSWSGVLLSTASSHAICVTANTDDPFYAFGPSHPPLPTPTITYPDNDDKIGLRYGLGTVDGILPSAFVTSAFSDQLAGLVFQDCAIKFPPLPAVALVSASYLTETLTSHVGGEAPSTSPVSLTRTPSVPQSSPTPFSVPAPEQGTTGASSTSTKAASVAEAPSASSKPAPTDEGDGSSGLDRIASASTVAVPRSTVPASASVSTPSAPTDAPMSSQAVMDLPPISIADSAPSSSIAPSNQFAQSLAIGFSVLPSSTTTVSAVISSFSATIPAVVTGTNTDALGQSITVETMPVVILIPGGQTNIVTGDSSTVPLTSVPAETLVPSLSEPLIINGQTITVNSQSQYIVGSQTLIPGGPAITVGSGSSATVIALQTSNDFKPLVVDTATSAPSPFPALTPVLTIGSETYTLNSATQYIIGTQTLAPGVTITIGSGSSTTVIALQTSNGFKPVVVDTATSAPSPFPALTPALIIGSETYTLNSATQYIIGTQTLAPGGTITIGSGSSTTVIALQTSNSQTQLIVGGSTSALSPSPALTPALIIGSETYTLNSATQFIIGTQTLAPGVTITIGSGTSTTVIALQTSNTKTQLVVGGSTFDLPAATPTPPLVTVGGSIYTPKPASRDGIATPTLIPGNPALSASGTSIPFTATASAVVVAGTGTVIESEALGGYIWSGIGGGGNSPASAATGTGRSANGTGVGLVPFTGGAERSARSTGKLLGIVMATALGMLSVLSGEVILL